MVTFTVGQQAHGPAALCFMLNDVPHEMLSPYENVDLTMYWLPELLNYAVAFIAGEEFFPVEPNPDEGTNTGPACLISRRPDTDK